MNTLKNKTKNSYQKVLSAIGILSLFCYLLFGLSINLIKAETQQTFSTPGLDKAGGMQQYTNTTGQMPGGVPQSNAQAQQIWSQGTGMPSNSSVLTPGSMVSQNGPPTASDVNCGINVISGTWNYCMLAPVNGLIGNLIGTSTEQVPINENSLQTFFAKIYQIGIAVVIALAIVMISLGGIRLATTDSVLGTDEGKKMVNAAFAGLFVALFSYVLLYTINPALLSNGNGSDGTSALFPTTNIPVITPTVQTQGQQNNNKGVNPLLTPAP